MESQTMDIDLPIREANSVESLLENVTSALAKKDIFAIGSHIQENVEDFGNAKVSIRWEGYPTLRLLLDDETALLNAPATMDANNFVLTLTLMGSLVVCLPVAHMGGKLALRHDGQQVEFDWASQHPETIQWAAFLYDCEHDIQPITEGYRVTLTYNLLWTKFGPSSMAAYPNLVDQQSMHFYNSLETYLKKLASIGKGNKNVGFSCIHPYPHTSWLSASKTHHMLKGIDMVVYQALTRLGYPVRVGVVLDDSSYVKDQLETKERERQRLEEKAKNPKNRAWSYREYYDDSDFENTVCMSQKQRPVWTDDWYRDNSDDPYLPDPVRQVGGFARAKVHWLNHAPDKDTPKDLAVAVCSVAEGEPNGVSYGSSVAIFSWVSNPHEGDKGDEGKKEVDEEDEEGDDADGWARVFKG
ncbi:hypothetical protein FAUST_7785 [Fusarium austroamericanum]|uniref:Fe2OG dioxygenase domain-containing protein n=1 Tax=Fusarium austroamericanum TaxID=282268 RepID=A0AAN6BYK6_FUSAU|nr:hypothetical protein FAUST_7785 [Fusarium austroamericanum]